MKIPAQSTILLVEDSGACARLFEIVLTQAGHKVCVARNMSEALVALEEEDRFATLVCDLVLPDGDGFQIAAKFKKKSKRGFAVAVTGLFSMVAEEQAYASGFDRFILKPVPPEEFAALCRL